MRIRPPDHTSQIRRQQQMQRASIKSTDKSRDTVKISDVYDLRDSSENRTMSPRSLSKSTSTNSGSVNRRTSGDSYPLIEAEVDDFVRVEFCEDGVIPTYNPREAPYPAGQETGSGIHSGEPSNRLIENGIPVFTKTGKFVRTTKVNGNAREKRNDNETDDIGRPDKPSYRLASEPFQKVKAVPIPAESKRVSSAQKSSRKTTTNSSGGAKITRSNVNPVMFTRYSKNHDPQTSPNPISNSQRNFCDDGKTYDILKWLTSVKEVQTLEGFSSFHIENGVRNP